MENENIYNLTKDFNDIIKSLNDNFRKKSKKQMKLYLIKNIKNY